MSPTIFTALLVFCGLQDGSSDAHGRLSNVFRSVQHSLLRWNQTATHSRMSGSMRQRLQRKQKRYVLHVKVKGKGKRGFV